MWVVPLPTTTHIPSFVTVTHIELWIYAFVVISQSEQICKWRIKYAYLVMTDNVGSTSAHYYPHTKFRHCSSYRIAFFVISQSEQICKWGIKYTHTVTTDHMGSTCVLHYPHSKFYEIGHCIHAKGVFFVEILTRNLHRPYIHTYRQTSWQQLKPKPAEGWTIHPHITISTELPENFMLHYSLKSTHLRRGYFNIF